MLTSKSDRLIPNYDLFKNMEQYENYTSLGIKPKQEALTLFVADQAVATPKKLVAINCGVIIDLVKFETNTMKLVLATMGDRHATCSKITILNVSP